jgi:hypothetical protein
MFFRASAVVSPWDQHPGRLGAQMAIPSSDGYRTTLNFMATPHAIMGTKRSKRQPKDRVRLKQIPFLHDRGVADPGAENPRKIVACQEGSNPGE